MTAPKLLKNYSSIESNDMLFREVHGNNTLHGSLPPRTRAMHPQALGDDIDVPFISWDPCRVQFGTDVIAPPGAEMQTPIAPLVLKNHNFK